MLTGGNPNLEAERAKTYAVGMTFTPSFLSGLTASVDYYHIKIDGTIGAIPLGVILQRCLDTGDPEFCSRIDRASNGTLFGTSVTNGGFISGTNVNVGSNKFSGIDIQANYNLPLETFGWDKWGPAPVQPGGHLPAQGRDDPPARRGGIRLRRPVRPAVPDGESDLAPHPADQLDQPLGRDVLGGLALLRPGEAGDRHQPADHRPGDDRSLQPRAAGPQLRRHRALWNVSSKIAVRAGVNNLFDQDPPLVNALIAGTGLPNTYPSYDLLGRKLFVGFTTRF